MAGKKIKAVLFDLGETLLSFGKVRMTRLFRQGAKLSCKYLKSQSQPVGNFEWYCWQNLIRVHIQRWLSSVTGRDFDMLALLKKVGAKKAIVLESQQWQHLAWLWYEPLSKTARIEPNIAGTLAKLKELGLKLGIVSNTSLNRCCLDKHLEQLGILDYFTVRVYSCELDFRKPDPRIFEIAAQRIGQAFENILFVGDHIKNDVDAAASLGMQAALLVNSTNASKKIPQGTWRINRLAELPSLIEKINAVSL
jgi:putative hydrolase of the HAD superfamily